MNRTSVLLLAVALLGAMAVVPTADAKPECLQVYPWSKLCEGELPVEPASPDCVMVYPWSMLCQGDVAGFVGHYVTLDCEVCLAPPVDARGPGVECPQVVPWSYLCSGDVERFVDHYVDTGNVKECAVEGKCIEFPTDCLHSSLCLDPVQSGPEPACLDVIPWSHLCNGDVESFVEYFVPVDAIQPPQDGFVGSA